MDKLELNSLTLEETKELMVDIGEKKFRGEQLFSALNKHMLSDINDIHLLPKSTREKLSELGKLNLIRKLNRFDSKVDDTSKFLFLLEDDNIIESVLMRYSHGNTACVSTQVGCKMGCEFCASTKDGFIRNLSPAEILNQVYMMELDLNIRIDNVVIMGSGEPLDNYDSTLKFMKILHEEKGHNTSFRNITLSTCGIVPRIYDLARENLPITLSISLHSPFDHIRQTMMPIAKKYSVHELIEACKEYLKKTNRRLTFEYTLVEELNDREKDAIELANILAGLNAHVNLIPLNPIKEYELDRPDTKKVKIFQNKLLKRNIKTTIRKEMGSDISGSCGQLRRNNLDSGVVK